MSLLKNYLYNVSYQLLGIFSPIITAGYLSRTLHPVGNGIFGYVGAFEASFAIFAMLGIPLYGNRFVAQNKNQGNLTKYFNEIWSMQIVSTLAVSLIYIITVILIGGQYRVFLLAQGITLIALGFDVSWFFQGLENFRIIMMRGLLVRIVMIVLIFTVIKSERDLLKYIIIQGLFGVIINLSLWMKLRQYVTRFYLTLNFRQHIKPTLVIFVPTVATSLYLQANKVQLGWLNDVKSVAYYQYADSFIKLALTIVTALGAVILPRVANQFAKGQVSDVKNMLYTSFEIVTAVSIFIMTLILGVANQFIPFFLGNDFSITGHLLICLSPIVILIAWTNVFGIQYLLPTNRTGPFSLSVLAGAAINIVFNFVFIPAWGAHGAVIATVAAELLVLLIQAYVLHHDISFKKLSLKVYKYFLIALPTYLVIRQCSYYVGMGWIQVLLIGLAGMTVYSFCMMVLKTNVYMMLKKIIMDRRVK